jgi:hypothetical protein
MKKFVSRSGLWRAPFVVGLLAALALAMPMTASAQYVPCGIRYDPTHPCGYLPDAHHPYAGWSGWGYVDANTCTGVCTAIYRTSVPAWRWNGRWSATSLANNTQVYIYPYATGWSWVWTQSTGWLAVSDNYVWVRNPVVYY